MKLPRPTLTRKRKVAVVTVGHVVVGGVVVGAMIVGWLSPAVGSAILVGLGSFWGGVGVALKSTGTSTAATVTGDGSVPSVSSPAPPESDPFRAPGLPDALARHS